MSTACSKIWAMRGFLHAGGGWGIFVPDGVEVGAFTSALVTSEIWFVEYWFAFALVAFAPGRPVVFEFSTLWRRVAITTFRTFRGYGRQ